VKGKILHILTAENSIVSGENLSSRLDISRVSIWKHIKKLQQLGYIIDSSPKGYRLTFSPDIPFAWEFPAREAKIHYFESVTSTMDIARDLARKGCPDFSVVIARGQTKGRGRLKRVWDSAAGGLYFTLVLRPLIPPVISPMVNFVISIVLARTLREMFAIDAMVKWPNDILVNGEKLSGMLSEMDTEADMVSFINIGLGININNDVPLVEPRATSLKKILGRRVSIKNFLETFLNNLESRMKNETFKNVIAEWKPYTMTINRTVTIVTHHRRLQGLVVDVDDTGALILELADGSREKIIYGDCFHGEYNIA